MLTVRQLARQVNAEHTRPQDAVQAFLIEADAKYRRANNDEAWRLLAGFLVHEERHVERTALQSQVSFGTRSPSGLEALGAIDAGVRGELLIDRWKVGDVVLGDATRDVLTLAAANEDEMSKGCLARRDFYAALAARIKGQKVRERLSDAQVKAMLYKLCKRYGVSGQEVAAE